MSLNSNPKKCNIHLLKCFLLAWFKHVDTIVEYGRNQQNRGLSRSPAVESHDALDTCDHICRKIEKTRVFIGSCHDMFPSTGISHWFWQRAERA